ncbi:MAG: RNA polymerase sigma factor [Campylobacteraceae bacterium]|nr:RNA polymerase sigma factor [Campylobacteraceae bacterium]
MTTIDLVEKYQPYLYNLALRLVYSAEDAKDLTQDVWVKILNSLDSFEEKSDFKTWAYRVMMNEFLNQKRKYTQLTFDDFENTMNNLSDEKLSNEYDEPHKQLLVHEAKVGCMMGMLMCLDYEQRAILVLGEIFEVSSSICAEIFSISKENFRKKLSRARADLYNFMNNHCGLVNKNNKCKCTQKTQALIKEGYVNPSNLLFSKQCKTDLKSKLQIKADKLDNTMQTIYKTHYQEHNFYESNEKEFAHKILKNKEIKEIFHF